MAKMVGWLHKDVGELMRQAGLQLIQILMEEEVKHLVGERRRQTEWLSHSVCSRGSWSRNDPFSSADRAASGPAPESDSSRRRIKRWHAPASSDRDPR